MCQQLCHRQEKPGSSATAAGCPRLRYSIGLRLSDEAIRVAVAPRLGCQACEPHTCACGKPVDARGPHGLSCRRSAPRQQRHSHLNGIILTVIKRAQILTVKEPVSLMRDNNKHLDGTTLLPWARGNPMAIKTANMDNRVQLFFLTQ